MFYNFLINLHWEIYWKSADNDENSVSLENNENNNRLNLTNNNTVA